MFWLGFVLYLEVVLFCFDFDWKFFEKGENAHFWKIQCSTPRRRSARLGVTPRRRSPSRHRNPCLGELDA